MEIFKRNYNFEIRANEDKEKQEFHSHFFHRLFHLITLNRKLQDFSQKHLLRNLTV